MKVGIYFSYNEKGPGKVATNLIKGLNLSGIDYSINSEGDGNIILQECDRLRGDLSNCIIGPNICTLPIDNSIVLGQNYIKNIVPSIWVKDLYSRWISPDKIIVWPCGIDTDLFKPSDTEKDKDFLVYFKRRDKSDLEKIEKKLENLGKKYLVIEYGKYHETEFLRSIHRSKYSIIVGGCESQGVAIQEILSCDVPILVWDTPVWGDRGEENKCLATSIPYWSECCGEFFYQEEQFFDKLDLLMSKKYSPRDFVLKNLGLREKSMEIIGTLNKHLKIK